MSIDIFGAYKCTVMTRKNTQIIYGKETEEKGRKGKKKYEQTPLNQH